MSSTRRRITGAAGTCIVVLAAVFSTAFVAVPAAQAKGGTTNSLARIGLYGQQDPTYDGAYRQSLSILALETANANIDPAAVRWLLRQQCDDGSWMSWHKKLAKPCGAPDSNATAMAVMALNAIGRNKPAKAGTDWLLANQLSGGGWEYSTGWGADSNSTGLVTQALIARGIDPTTVDNNGTPLTFLASLQLGCDAVEADRGALDYSANVPLAVNNYATAQAAQALTGSALPVDPNDLRNGLPDLDCPDATGGILTSDPDEAAVGYLGRTLRANDGTVPNAFGPGADYGSTMNAVLSLVSSTHGGPQVKKAVHVLHVNVRTIVKDTDGKTLPAGAALFVLTEKSVKGNARDVRGVNLIKRLQTSITTRD